MLAMLHAANVELAFAIRVLNAKLGVLQSCCNAAIDGAPRIGASAAPAGEPRAVDVIFTLSKSGARAQKRVRIAL
jgi:hypothetical protein